MISHFIPSFREVLLVLSAKSFSHPPPLRRRLPSLLAFTAHSPGKMFSPLLIRSSALSGYCGSEDVNYFPKASRLSKKYWKHCLLFGHEHMEVFRPSTQVFRLDYQPLFGKGAGAPRPNSGRNVDRTRESGGNRAYQVFCH